MLIGYARTSTADQEARFEAQLACCEDVGTVKSSAVRTSSGYAIRSKPLLWPGRHSSACIRPASARGMEVQLHDLRPRVRKLSVPLPWAPLKG